MAAKAASRVLRQVNPNILTRGGLVPREKFILQRRNSSSEVKKIDFGLFFDIDGVIVRGRTLLPSTRSAFKLLTNDRGKFIVPTIFVTNAGNMMRHKKAAQLSEWIGVEVREDQVIMSHSPLRLFRQYMDKHVLVSGQGNTREIAEQLGFTKVTTIETLRQCFPMLDMVDHKRRKTAPCAFEKYFPKIEAVILFGEPVRWETNLQLILDVLLSNGQPSMKPERIVYPHMPVLACNMDLVWMSEAPMPRFAHGSFIHCLESLYQKFTGYELKYTGILGKPSEITYHHAEHVLQEEAKRLGLQGIRKMYCIGDNPDVDIYGANLYNQYLMKNTERKLAHLQQIRMAKKKGSNSEFLPEDSITEVEGASDIFMTEACESVLVCTGVYSKEQTDKDHSFMLDRNHRDFIMSPEWKTPTMTVSCVYEAVNEILKREAELS